MTESDTIGKSVLPKHLGGGPHGLGDPDDKSLRKVERDILIPNIVRDRARKEKCTLEAKAFNECGKEAQLMVIWRCKDENKALLSCLDKWFNDKDFVKQCTQQYLDERSEYRRTGVPVRKYVRHK